MKILFFFLMYAIMKMHFFSSSLSSNHHLLLDCVLCNRARSRRMDGWMDNGRHSPKKTQCDNQCANSNQRYISLALCAACVDSDGARMMSASLKSASLFGGQYRKTARPSIFSTGSEPHMCES